MPSWMRTHRGDGFPFLLSVPHGGLLVPTEVRDFCCLSQQDVRTDGDVHAAEIYWPLAQSSRAFIASHVARAIIDLNRAEKDWSRDGVVKSHTCWEELVYDPAPPDSLLSELVDRYWKPYHAQLTELFGPDILVGIDCHTMAAHGPPIGPDPNAPRPLICLGNVRGDSCPDAWLEMFADALEQTFGERPSLNEPFAGGYITRGHGASRPWIQLEISRSDRMSAGEKRERLRAALELFAEALQATQKSRSTEGALP